MSIGAPPRGHDALAGVEHDPIEALIEEARERARRRRRLYGIAASVAVIAVVATVVGFNGAGSSPAERAARDSAAESPVGDLGVFERIRGWIVFPDGAGGIEAVDPNNPSSRHTVLANPEGISDSVAPTGWSADGTELALIDQGGSGSWIMDSTGSLNNVVPFSGCCAGPVDNPFTPDGLKGFGTVLWRLSDGTAYLIPSDVADWITLDDRRVGAEKDTTRQWEASLNIGHTALSPDGEQLLLTAPAAHGTPDHWWRVRPNSATTQGLYVLAALGPSAADGTNPTSWLHSMATYGLDADTMRRIAAGSYLAAMWSPDGTQIAAISETPKGLEIVVMNADGTDQQTLIELPDGFPGFAWHPLAPND